MFTSRTNQNLKVLSFIVVTVFGFQAVSFAEPASYNVQPTTPGYATSDVLARSSNQDSQIQTLNSPEPLPQDAPPPVGGTHPLVDPFTLTNLNYEAEIIDVPKILGTNGAQKIPKLALLGGESFLMSQRVDDHNFDEDAYIFDGETFTHIDRPGSQANYASNILGEYIFIELLEENYFDLMADVYLVSGGETIKLTDNANRLELSGKGDTGLNLNKFAKINDRGDVLWFTAQDQVLHYYDAVTKEVTDITNTGIYSFNPMFDFNSQGDVVWYDVSDSDNKRVMHFKDGVVSELYRVTNPDGDVRVIRLTNSRMVQIEELDFSLLSDNSTEDTKTFIYNLTQNTLHNVNLPEPTQEDPILIYAPMLADNGSLLLDYGYFDSEYLLTNVELYSYDYWSEAAEPRYQLIDQGDFGNSLTMNDAGMILYKNRADDTFFISDGTNKGQINIVNSINRTFDHPFETLYTANNGTVFVVDQGLVILRPYTDIDPTPKRLKGDANEDGVVNLADFNILKGNFGKSFEIGAESEGDAWPFGDFNGDKKIDLADFNALKTNFGMSADICETEPGYCV